MPFHEARQVIARGRGSHFDPDVTDAFLNHFDIFTAIAERHGERHPAQTIPT